MNDFTMKPCGAAGDAPAAATGGGCLTILDTTYEWTGNQLKLVDDASIGIH